MFGILKNHEMPKDPLRMNEVVLAYLGDCIYELYNRNLSVESGASKVFVLDKMSSSKSKASYQAEALKKLLPELTETEAAVARRARNKKITSKPRNATPEDYKMATAFEALVGYLYLTEQQERMEYIIASALGQIEDTENGDTGENAYHSGAHGAASEDQNKSRGQDDLKNQAAEPEA